MIIALLGQNTKRRNTKMSWHKKTHRQNGLLKMNAQMLIPFACVLLNTGKYRMFQYTRQGILKKISFFL